MEWCTFTLRGMCGFIASMCGLATLFAALGTVMPVLAAVSNVFQLLALGFLTLALYKFRRRMECHWFLLVCVVYLWLQPLAGLGAAMFADRRARWLRLLRLVNAALYLVIGVLALRVKHKHELSPDRGEVYTLLGSSRPRARRAAPLDGTTGGVLLANAVTAASGDDADGADGKDGSADTSLQPSDSGAGVGRA